MEEYFFNLFQVNTRINQSTKMISRPEERDMHNVCFLNCNLFEFFMKQSKDCLPLGLLLSRKRRKHLLPETKCLLLFSALSIYLKLTTKKNKAC